MTTTKHEGECLVGCRPELGKHTIECPNLPQYGAEPTGAGMREEFKQYIEFDKDFILDDRAIEGIAKWFEARLSRLHSRIVEEVEKAKPVWDGKYTTKRYERGVKDGLDTSKEIVNQAFKDL